MTGAGEKRVKDMAITWNEFVRLLPNGLPGWTYQIEEPRVEIGSPERGATIVVSPLPARQFGPLQLARLKVEIEFRGFDATAVETFMGQFDRAFQRGGG